MRAVGYESSYLSFVRKGFYLKKASTLPRSRLGKTRRGLLVRKSLKIRSMLVICSQMLSNNTLLLFEFC